MKRWLLIGAIILAIIVVASFLKECRERGVQEYLPDSSFVTPRHETYRPSSIPFVKKTSGIKLPQGLSEGEVKKVTRLRWKDGKTTEVIEDKEGRVYVAKDDELSAVEVVEFKPPAVAIDFSPGLGVSAGRNGLSPFAKISFVSFYDVVRFPMLGADKDGAGVGIEAIVYHNISIGVLQVWQFDNLSERMLKFTIHYSF